MTPVLNAVGIVTADMARSLEFYRLLGLGVPDTPDAGHVNIDVATLWKVYDATWAQMIGDKTLREMERKAGGAVFTSSHWIWNECIRLTALTGLRYATEPENGPQVLKQQEDWMIRLGHLKTVAA